MRYLVIIILIVGVVGTLMFCHQRDSEREGDLAHELRGEINQGLRELEEPCLVMEKYLAEAGRAEDLAAARHNSTNDTYELTERWADVEHVEVLTAVEFRRRQAEHAARLGAIHRRLAAITDPKTIPGRVQELKLKLARYGTCGVNFRDQTFEVTAGTKLESAANLADRFRKVAPAEPPPAPAEDDPADPPPVVPPPADPPAEP